MTFRLVALDIDGTIVHPHSPAEVPSARVTAAVAELTRRGVAVVLASGRMLPGTARIARHLGLNTPVVCQQGCSIHAADGEMLHRFALPHDLALDLVSYARELDRPYEWFDPVRYIASIETPQSEEYARVSGITAEYRLDPENSGLVPTGVGIISSNGEANGIHRAIVARHADALHALDFPSVTVAVSPDANKGHAVSLIAAALGIDRHQTLAIGDSVNDAAMLAWAGLGLAVAHADQYALDAADDVLDGEADSAVAGVLEGLLRD